MKGEKDCSFYLTRPRHPDSDPVPPTRRDRDRPRGRVLVLTQSLTCRGGNPTQFGPGPFTVARGTDPTLRNKFPTEKFPGKTHYPVRPRHLSSGKLGTGRGEKGVELWGTSTSPLPTGPRVPRLGGKEWTFYLVVGQTGGGPRHSWFTLVPFFSRILLVGKVLRRSTSRRYPVPPLPHTSPETALPPQYGSTWTLGASRPAKTPWPPSTSTFPPPVTRPPPRQGLRSRSSLRSSRVGA